MLERMQRKGNPRALLVGMQTGEATVDVSLREKKSVIIKRTIEQMFTEQ